jgi:hypothetical protein
MNEEDLRFGGFYRLWCSISEINRGNEESEESWEVLPFGKEKRLGKMGDDWDGRG